jgi:hypothetical protein
MKLQSVEIEWLAFLVAFGGSRVDVSSEADYPLRGLSWFSVEI